MQALIAAVGRYQRAEASEPHAHADAEAEYSAELVQLAARDLVRETEANAREHGHPVGWDDSPVHGVPDEPTWAAHREHCCGGCGEVFGSNCAPGEIRCPACEARLCASCGHWQGGGSE